MEQIHEDKTQCQWPVVVHRALDSSDKFCPSTIFKRPVRDVIKNFPNKHRYMAFKIQPEEPIEQEPELTEEERRRMEKCKDLVGEQFNECIEAQINAEKEGADEPKPCICNPDTRTVETQYDTDDFKERNSSAVDFDAENARNELDEAKVEEGKGGKIGDKYKNGTRDKRKSDAARK